jgi:hypothetical protein
MISLSTAALVAVPATHVASRLASGIANVGKGFIEALSDSPSEQAEGISGEHEDESQDAGATKSHSAQSSSPFSKPKSAAATNPASLADLLQSIQDLISNLSDDATDSVTIESVGNDEVQVTGDEPLASSIKQWTRLHPEWARGWNAQVTKSNASSDVQQRISAKISATSVTLE